MLTFLHPHKLGLLSYRKPLIAVGLLALTIVSAVIGVSRISQNFAIASMFAADSEEYRDYAAFKQSFPLNDRDVLFVAQSKGLNEAQIEAVRELHLELELLEEVDGVLSVFSLPEGTSENLIISPHIPEILPTNGELNKLLAEISADNIGSKFLGFQDDEPSWLIVVATLNQSALRPDDIIPSMQMLEDVADEYVSGTNLQMDLIGVPALESAFKVGGRSDRRTFNIAGLIIGLFVSILIFRDFRYVAMVFLCPVLSVFCTYGAMGLAGKEFSLLMGAAPPLIMVVAFANAMHLTQPIKRAFEAGGNRDHAVEDVLINVGPACFLAMTTTGLALLSLIANGSGPIRDFAIISSVGMAVIFVVSMLIIPLVARLLLPKKRPAGILLQKNKWMPISNFSDWLSDWLPKCNKVVLAISLVAFVALGFLHSRLDVHHRLSDEVPRSVKSLLLSIYDEVPIASPNPLFVVMQYPSSTEFDAPVTLEVLRDLHDQLAAIDAVPSVWSVKSIEDTLSEDGKITSLLDEMPDLMRLRFLNPNERLHLVTLHLPNLDSNSIINVSRNVENILQRFAQKHVAYDFRMTGLSIVSARHATTTIPDLHRSLWIAVFIVFVFISWFFKSVSLSLFALLPNILPIVATGTVLHLLGWGLGYASMIALTVAFGIAVDDSIHFLSRYASRREHGTSPTAAVQEAIRGVSPIIVITTLVLTAGLSVTFLGQMPHTQIFGVLCCVTLIFALLADLFVLPTIILAFDRRRLGKVEFEEEKSNAV